MSSLIGGRQIQKINIYTKPNIEHVCNSGTTLQNFGEEGQEKRMTESTVTSVKVEGVMIAIESC
jgi:hypothetical protein